MLKKSLSLLVVFLMSLTLFSGVVSLAATAAPTAPAGVAGATYYLNETFSALPSGTKTLTSDASYTLSSSSSNSFNTDYNAVAIKAYAKGVFSPEITAAGDYVLSVDFMAPDISLGQSFRVYLDSTYKVAEITATGLLNLCQAETKQQLQSNVWYRLTANVTLSSGDISATVTNLSANTDVASKSATGKVTKITQLQVAPSAASNKELYTQNWQLYKKGAETGGDSGEEGGETPTVTPAPNAPADVENATYLLKETFNATLANNSTGTTGTTTYTWTTTDNRNAYDSTYNALNQDKALTATFSNPITADGNYVFTMDFMLPNTNLSADYKVYLFDNFKIMQLSKENGTLYLCQTDTGKKMTDLATEKWYRLTVNVSLPSKNIKATITDASTGTEIASKSTTNSNATQIKHIKLDGSGLYTQNWRLYKEYQKEYPVAPTAPADVQGAQYIIRNDFSSVPNGTDTYNENLTWIRGGNLNYNANYKALNHAAYLQGNFSSAVKQRGNYTFTMNFMVDNPTTLTDAYNLQINDFYVMSIAAETGKISLGGEETAVVVEDEKWYTVEAVMLVPDCTVDIKILDATDNSVVCSKSFNAIINFEDGISKIRLSNKKTAQTQLYTQSWRMYMLPHDFIAELNDGKITASYNSETEENAFIIIALYEGNSLKASSCKAYRNHTGLVTTSIDYIDGCNVKAFLWDPDSLAPFFHCIQDDDIRK
ncbi:MAG: hypothetical protein IJB96_12770 [Lachnospira sp.]|nr:hypothetical protein [Lachnospira sp.]